MVATILDQHPDVHIDLASALAYVVGAMNTTISTEPEVQLDLAVPAHRARYLDAYRGLIAGWHGIVEQPVVIDKNRAWCMWPELLAACNPEQRVVMCVRDPRDVVASVERAHVASPEFAHAAGGTLVERVATLMRPGGKIGEPLRRAEDLIRRNVDVVWVQYEQLTTAPHVHVARLAEALGLAAFDFDLDGLDRDEPLHDAQLLHKWPHRVSGPVKPNEKHWSEVIPEPLAAEIAGAHPLFMRTFGYA